MSRDLISLIIPLESSFNIRDNTENDELNSIMLLKDVFVKREIHRVSSRYFLHYLRKSPDFVSLS